MQLRHTSIACTAVMNETPSETSNPMRRVERVTPADPIRAYFGRRERELQLVELAGKNGKEVQISVTEKEIAVEFGELKKSRFLSVTFSFHGFGAGKLSLEA